MKSILIVDDTKNIRNLLTTCLELRGCKVCTARNGTEAMELVSSYRFDLAFLDVKMPELSGTEVLKRIREQGHSYPVVMMTAYATVKNAVECTKLGAVAYLQKPFTADKINELMDTLETISCQENSITSLLDKAKQLHASGNYADAYAMLKKCLSLDPGNKDVYHQIGMVHEAMNEPEEADKFFRASGIFDK